MTPDTPDPFDPEIAGLQTASATTRGTAPFHRQVADGMARARILRGRAMRQALAAVFLTPLRIATALAKTRAVKGGSPAAVSR